MALNFPSTPTDGQEYTVGSRTWAWDAAKSCWNLVPNTLDADALVAQIAEAAASAVAAAAAGVRIVWSTITGPASVAASVSGGYLCDAAAGAITITLPNTASEGDEVVVATMAEAPLYPVTLSGGGVALMDQPEDLILNLPQTEFRCRRRADPYGWHIIASGVGLSTNGNATNVLSESRIVNVPTDYATLDAALEYASSLIPLNGASLTIEIEDTETIGQISLRDVDLSFLHIKGLGAGPWIDRDVLNESIHGPTWIFAYNAKLNSVYGTFRVTGESENVQAVNLYNCDMCLGRYGEWEPLVVDGVMKGGINIDISRVTLIGAALDSGEDETCIFVWGSDVVSYDGTYTGNIYLDGGRFSSNEDSFASISGRPGPTIRVTNGAEMNLSESTVKGLISVTGQSIMRGEVAITEHEDTQMTGSPLIVADRNSVVSLEVSDFEPLEESSVPLAKASDLSHITLTTFGGLGATSLGLAAEVETGGKIFLGSNAAAAFSGGFSQTPNQLSPDGFIFVEGMEVPSGGIETIVAGTGISVDTTDPANPIVAAAAAGGGGGGSYEFVSEVVVTTAQQDIDFSSLDLDADAEYVLKIYAVPSVTTAHTISLYYNGDTTAANYQRIAMLSGTANNVSTGRANDAHILYAAGAIGATSDVLAGQVLISKASGLKPMACCIGNSFSSASSSILTLTANHIRNNTANVTDIKLRHSNNFGVGTRVRLYKLTKVVPSDVGKQIGYAYTQSSTASTTTALIPIDGTIPQNTEGAEYSELTTEITPKSDTSLLEVEISMTGVNNSAVNNITVALFRDSGTDAIAATFARISAVNAGTPISLKAVVVAGSTAPTTFKVRYGGQSAGTSRIMESSTAVSFFSSSTLSSMTIKEIGQ